MTWTPEIWGTAAFLDGLREWMRPHTGEVHSMVRVKDRPWSGVWRVDARNGVFYVKQNCPVLQQEARVVSVLARVAPDLVVPPVAVDVKRDLLLTAETGPTYREALAAGSAVSWEDLLRDAMLLARASVPVLDELRMPVLDPAGIGELIARAGAEWDIPDEFREGADAALDLAGEAGDRLAALGLPLALNHNDLHDANAFLVDGRARFFDFGDSVASSPLTALRIPLAVYARSIDTTEDDPRVLRLADAALEVWSDLVPLDALRSALPDAHRLAAVARAATWHRVITSMPIEFVPDDYCGADADWLAEAGA
ncbi:hypothetical protein [Microbacterium sp.]|uniref:hypothetical protein n=1 Tax=Microbacterium sp. TaxID=51671 RepID=UPI003C748A81